MNNIKVSVIIPIYNVEKYLDRCLSSVTNQTLEEIEIICVNDGSTDSCMDIISRHSDKVNNIKVISKENTGYGDSVNIGIENAMGEYVCILESDDYAKINMCKEMYEKAKSNNLDILRANYYANDEKMGAMYQSICDVIGYENVFCPIDNLNIFLLTPYVWSYIYNRKFIMDNNIRFTRTKGASYQDVAFNFKCLSLAKRMMVLDRAYVYYTIDNPNSSIRSKDKVYCICDQYSEVECFLNNNIYLKKCLWEVKNIIKLSAYKWNYRRLSDELKPMFRRIFVAQFMREIEDGTLTSTYVDELYWSELYRFCGINK